jgi:hypothetical protein
MWHFGDWTLKGARRRPKWGPAEEYPRQLDLALLLLVAAAAAALLWTG